MSVIKIADLAFNVFAKNTDGGISNYLPVYVIVLTVCQSAVYRHCGHHVFLTSLIHCCFCAGGDIFTSFLQWIKILARIMSVARHLISR